MLQVCYGGNDRVKRLKQTRKNLKKIQIWTLPLKKFKKMTKFVTKITVVWPYLWRSVKMTVIAHDRIEKYGDDSYLTVIFVSIDAVKKWWSLHISKWRTTEISEFRIQIEKWDSIFLFLCLFKLFPQYIWYFIKLEIYGISIVFHIVKFWKFAIFRNCIQLGNLMISEDVKFGKFLELSKLNIFDNSKLEIFGIFQTGTF